VGVAHAALAQRAHREGAAIAARFLSDGGGNAAAAAGGGGGGAGGGGAGGGGYTALLPGGGGDGAVAAPCKVLKMGDCAMKRLRNGDIYKVAG
jgi:hypothetical protein